MIFELNEPSIEVHNIVKVVGFYEPKSGKLPYRNNWIGKHLNTEKTSNLLSVELKHQIRANLNTIVYFCFINFSSNFKRCQDDK